MTVQVFWRVNFDNSRPRSIVSGIVCAFSDDAIACKDAIQVGPNYKPGGATFGAGTKTPIGARLVTYL